MVDYLPDVSETANKMGFLLGPYDSYGSIHNPDHFGTDNSWPTTQFDRKLYETGGIVGKNGKKKGFAGKGYKLNPIAARPYVEERVNRLMKNTPYNYYFIDCDAYGEEYDDYSPLHPTSKEESVQEKIHRMKWISDTFKTVIGSEGGSSFAAPVVHVIEGNITKPFGPWMDKDFRNKKSKYYLGRYYPQHAPEDKMMEVPLKEKYVYFNYNPEFRLPLNETVFHDSFVSTCHYGSANFKFSNVKKEIELTTLLYMVPPMYHLNIEEFKKRKNHIKKHYDFFSPLHKQIGFSEMTDFTWLTDDRLVQKTIFGKTVEMVANFSEDTFNYGSVEIPPKSILGKTLADNQYHLYTP